MVEGQLFLFVFFGDEDNFFVSWTCYVAWALVTSLFLDALTTSPPQSGTCSAVILTTCESGENGLARDGSEGLEGGLALTN